MTKRRAPHGQPHLATNRVGTWCIAWPRRIARELDRPRLETLGTRDRSVAERTFRVRVSEAFAAIGDERAVAELRRNVQSMTLDVAIADFLRDLANGIAPPKPSASTMETQYIPSLLGRGGLLPFARAHGVSTTTQLTAAVVERFLDARRAAGAADDTIRLRLVAVRRFVRWAASGGLLAELSADAIAALKRPRGARGRARADGVPTLEEVRALLNTLSPRVWRIVAETQLRLGLRRGEVLRLRDAWIRDDAVVVPAEPTKDKEARSIECDSVTLALARETACLLAKEHLTIDGYRMAWRRAIESLKRRGVIWAYRAKTHALRQAYATESIVRGLPPRCRR